MSVITEQHWPSMGQTRLSFEQRGLKSRQGVSHPSSPHFNHWMPFYLLLLIVNSWCTLCLL